MHNSSDAAEVMFPMVEGGPSIFKLRDLAIFSFLLASDEQFCIRYKKLLMKALGMDG